MGFEGPEGGGDVFPEADLEFQPVRGDPYRFEVVWQLHPAQDSTICSLSDLLKPGYQLRPDESGLPFQREFDEFRLEELGDGLLTARVPFVVVDPPQAEVYGETVFRLYHLIDPDRPEDPEAYERVQRLALHLRWRLLPPLDPTATVTPKPPTRTPQPPTPTATPAPGSAALPTPELLDPSDNASIADTATFRWNWSGTLADSQRFEVRVRKRADQSQEHRGVSAKTTELFVAASFVSLVSDTTHWNTWQDGQVFQGAELWWSVAVIGEGEETLTESGFRKLVFTGPTSDGGEGGQGGNEGGGEQDPCAGVDCENCSCKNALCKQCCDRCRP